MSETMTGRDYYIEHGYDELPDAVRKEMRRVFDTGVNNSGVWVRFREVENLAGVMAYEYTNKPSSERKGKWILTEHLWQCDQCGCRQNEKSGTNFCPNCGADMRGEEDETD